MDNSLARMIKYNEIHIFVFWIKEEYTMPTKDRLLVLLQTLQQYSDDETPLTTADLIEALMREGHECSVRTLRRDIRSLQDCGYEIDVREKTEGGYTRYAWVDREWSAPELQILVDAVSAAQFIPQGWSEMLIGKLAGMAGPSHVRELIPQIMVSERIKAKNKDMIYSVQAIRKAIEKDRKISFTYLQYNTKKEQVPKHEGTPEEVYVVSPYATVWNSNRYYLVGWSDKRQKVAVFRIDRMKVPVILRKKREPAPEDYDVRDYTDKVFRMYGGPEEQVTLVCDMEILDQVIDRFGEQVELKDVWKDRFTVTVPVNLSTTFYAWVFQYVGKMRIQGPEYVREKYAGYLEQAMDEALGE